MITYANMDGENPLNGDLPSFVPVETILKEDVDPISVDTDKPGSLMMNLETRELFLSNDAASPQQQQQQQQQQRQQRQQPQQQQFALSANEKSSNVAKELFLSNDAASPQQQHQQQQQFALSANEKSSNLAKELFLSNDAASPQQPQQQQQHQQQQQPQQQQFALSANEKSSNLAKDLDAGAMVVANKQWDCNLCSPLLKKALQRERLQALRQNPSYREMERLRQRSMMQLKRQDPSFRELERERQRSRMQLRRQDPGFRAMERERQRRRMRLKRRDPAFREREREQQKSRLLVKRSADKLPIALDVSSSSSSMLTGTSTSIVSSQASSQLALPPPPHHQALPLQSHMPLPSSSSRPQSQQPPPSSQQHGKGVPLTNCLVPHDMPKQRGATALYGHLQRIVGYHNLLQGRPHPEDPGSSFKSPYFAGEPSGGLMARRMGGPQGHHGGSSKAVVPAGAGRQKSFLNGGPCHPLGEAFASSYPIMRDQGLSLTGPQPCGVPDGPPLLHAATNADAGRNSHLALLGSETEMLPSVPDCPECLEAQRERSQCGICQGQEQQQLAAAGSSGRSSGRRRSSRQSTERFRCTVCAKEFGMKHHLKEHYKSHGDRNLCCPHCDYRTCYGYALRRHVIIRHDRPAARQAQVIQQLTVQC